MTAYPRSRAGRILLGVWLAACLAVLLFAFIQRNVHDTDIAFGYFMLFLTFPVGVGVAAIAGVTFKVLYDLSGIVVPGGFVPNLVTWVVLVLAGYFQWFIAVPWLCRRWRQSSNHTVEGTRARAARAPHRER